MGKSAWVPMQQGCRGADLHDMAAEAVLHNALESAPGDALQQAVIPFLFGSLGAKHGRNQCLQGFPAREHTLSFAAACHLL